MNVSELLHALTMPAGLAWHDGALYSTAWSIAGLLGIPHAGQVVTVSPSAFVAAPQG